MASYCYRVAASALLLQFAFSSAIPQSFSFIGSRPTTRTGTHPASPAWRCKPSRLAVAASRSPESPSEQKRSPADKLKSRNVAVAQEEDERKTERWGVAPAASPGKGSNPLKAVSSSIRAVGDGVSATKDAVYDVADAAGTLIESTRKRTQGRDTEGKQSSSLGAVSDSVIQGASTRRAKPKRGGGDGGVIAVLKAVGAGAVFMKDAVWGSVELLGEAADAAKNAPQTARDVVESSKVALETARGNVQSVIAVPARAAEAISGAVDGAGRAAAGVKDGVYGTVDAVGKLASAPAAIAARREREQQERDAKEVEEALARRGAANKLDSAVTGAKTAVWSTVEGARERPPNDDR